MDLGSIGGLDKHHGGLGLVRKSIGWSLSQGCKGSSRGLKLHHHGCSGGKCLHCSWGRVNAYLFVVCGGVSHGCCGQVSGRGGIRNSDSSCNWGANGGGAEVVMGSGS